MITTKSTKQELIDALKKIGACDEAIAYYDSIGAPTAGKVIEYTFLDKNLPDAWFYWFAKTMKDELDDVYLGATIRRIKNIDIIVKLINDVDDERLRRIACENIKKISCLHYSALVRGGLCSGVCN